MAVVRMIWNVLLKVAVWVLAALSRGALTMLMWLQRTRWMRSEQGEGKIPKVLRDLTGY